MHIHDFYTHILHSPNHQLPADNDEVNNYHVPVYDDLAFDILAPDILALTFWHLGRLGTRDIWAPDFRAKTVLSLRSESTNSNTAIRMALTSEIQVKC